MAAKHKPYISKSKYLEGLRCPKLLWYEYNRKDELLAVDAATQAIFDQGHLVGELAHGLFPGGIFLEREFIPEKHAEKSLEAAKLRKPMFEAGFVYNQAYALADILNPAGDNAWDLIEVKSSTGVKDEYYPDVAFQRYAYKGAGIKIRKCLVMYINNEYVRKGKINVKELFRSEDVTKKCDEFSADIEKNMAEMLKAIENKSEPKVMVGPRCETPRDCPLKDKCWSFLPPKGHIFCLYSGGKKSYEFMGRGILSLADIEADADLNPKQAIQVACHKNEATHVDRKEIAKFLFTLKYPLYFFDFETIGPAIPVYDDSSPFEAVPFQFSLYIVKSKGAKPEGHSYIAPGNKDPRPEILKELKKLLGDSGSVIAYNAGFEKNVLRKASGAYPEYKGWVEDIEGRMVDLLAPFRGFSYYHPGQSGSASLKSVLPVLTECSYSGMEIAEGTMASLEYSRVTFGKDVPEAERRRVYEALEKYCDLDTKGMVDILAKLQELVE